jgi:solute carrier family 25 citrate transporter 1
MAIRFFSFELYKDWLGRDPVTGKTSFWATFLAGLGAGTTESIMVVTPMVS